jgi:hypothetical protein
VNTVAPKPAWEWQFPKPFCWRTLLAIIVAFMVLFQTGADVETGRAIFQSGKGIAAGAGLADDSQVARGFTAILRRMFPRIAQCTSGASHPLPNLADQNLAGQILTVGKPRQSGRMAPG